MMSWFDTIGIANLAKSALKEAQKTIDKALDIKDEELIENTLPIESSAAESVASKMSETIITQSPSRLQSPTTALGSSIWGSFTGSFFDPKEVRKFDTDLADDTHDVSERFSKSQLVVRTSIEETLEPTTVDTLMSPSAEQAVETDNKQIIRRERSGTTSVHNRLSALSSNSTESLELLSLPTTPGSNLTSPSSAPIGPTSESVEILPSGSDSQRLSLCTNSENTSPFISPTDTSIELVTPSSSDETTNTDSKNHPVKKSPDSVEVIPDDLCDDDLSFADDSVSYNSVSENTAVTVLENLRPFLMQMGDSGHSEVSNASDRTIDVPITRAPSKTGLHLSLQQQQDVNSSKDPKQPEVASASLQMGANYESEEGSGSEKTVIIEDTSSTNVTNLLEDAMTEKSCITQTHQSLTESMQSFEDVRSIISSTVREFSPISSEKSSDIVKVGSEQTSGHTSADELETTTSSDIEIISSPNGESTSSTHSRLSPAVGKLVHHSNKQQDATGKDGAGGHTSKTRGHCREPSETSSHSMSEDSEHDRLAKTIMELTELLEARENKLLEIGRKNAELMEANVDLKNQLETSKSKQDAMDVCSSVAEEYTQRLSALEKKFQQAIREKDALRKQTETLKLESASRMSKGEMEDAINERDQTIKELREEGEKLSKQQLQYGNIIKKLRAKEKENDGLMKKQKEELDALAQESERLKRTLNAKNDIERDQMSAIDRLTSENTKLARDVAQYRGEVEDHVQKQKVMRKSLEAARGELEERCRATGELSKRDKALTQLEADKRRCEEHAGLLVTQLDDLRSQVTRSEQCHRERAERDRLERDSLAARAEEAELRAERLAQAGAETTKPLVRQLEAMREAAVKRSKAWERQEAVLVEKIDESQNTIKRLTESEKEHVEEITQLRAKISDLNARLNQSMDNENKLLLELETMKTVTEEVKQETEKNQQEETSQIESLRGQIAELKSQLQTVQSHLSAERANCETERRRGNQLQEALNRERNQPLVAAFASQQQQQQQSIVESIAKDRGDSRESSPTLSLGRMSGSGSVHSALWHLDDSADCNSSVAEGGLGTAGSVYEIYRGASHSTQILENLQSLVKQRDGEIQQMNYEVSRLTCERDCLSAEMAKITQELEKNAEQLEENQGIAEQMQELQRQYDALLQMYGEKMEENQELLLDLQDVKDMYKLQIDELLAKGDSNK